MATVLLTNIEYNFLFSKGEDGHLALFATLRCCKKNIVIKKEGKKGPCALIRSLTGLSRTTIERFLPLLLYFNMVNVTKNGNIVVRGRNWSDKNLPGLSNRKLIPIEICKKFTDTKISVAFVRVHSNIQKQKSQIGKKAERIELIEQLRTGRINNLRDLKRAKTLIRKVKSNETTTDHYRLNSTLSNLGFDKLNKGSKVDTRINKSSGNYFKSKLLNRGLITQSRNVVLAYPNVKNLDFLDQLREEVLVGGYFIGRKGIYFEDSPRIEIVSVANVGSKKKQVKK